MQLEAKKYLHDMRHAAELIARFTEGRSLDEYARDVQLRSAVERQFEIIGEALAQLSRLDPALAARISEKPRIIAFRNILIHGYAELDHRIVWDIVQSKLPTLRNDVEALLAEG